MFSICVLITKPKGDELSTLGVRTAFATYVSGVETKVLLLEDGVYNALPHPGYNTDMFKRVIEEGAEVYCLKKSMEERGLTEEGFMEGIQIIDEEAVAEMVAEGEAFATF